MGISRVNGLVPAGKRAAEDLSASGCVYITYVVASTIIGPVIITGPCRAEPSSVSE